MKTMKRYIVNWMLCGIVSLWMFSSCEDYDFKDIPDPEIPEDMTPGLKLSRNEIMIDAMGNAQGFELRSIGGGFRRFCLPCKPTTYLLRRRSVQTGLRTYRIWIFALISFCGFLPL